MILAVLDTKVLASGALARTGTIAAVLDAALAGQFRVVLSQGILTELERTLKKSYFAARLGNGSSAQYVALLKSIAHITPLTTPLSGVATHPEDDVILSTALSAGADFLVTGDQRLQAVQIHRIQIVSPSAFLALLSTDSGPQATP